MRNETTCPTSEKSREQNTCVEKNDENNELCRNFFVIISKFSAKGKSQDRGLLVVGVLFFFFFQNYQPQNREKKRETGEGLTVYSSCNTQKQELSYVTELP